jgi:hypothetical protein
MEAMPRFFIQTLEDPADNTIGVKILHLLLIFNNETEIDL